MICARSAHVHIRTYDEIHFQCSNKLIAMIGVIESTLT